MNLGAYGESGIRNNKKLSITNGANTSFNNINDNIFFLIIIIL
jgi:hypothetical protein